MGSLLTSPWIIGTSVTVIGGLILYFVFGVGREKNTRKITQSERTGEKFDRGGELSSELTPEKIIDEIRKVPVFQRETLAESYKNIKIENWNTTLQSARKISNDRLHLMLLDRGNYPWVYADVEEKEYPKLKIMKEGEKVIISGTIQKVEGNTVELKDTKLKL